MSATEFDPDKHQVVPKKSLGDFRVGEVYRMPSRTVTEAQFAMFQALSGDNHPIHYDREYCKQQGHDDLVAHGFQVLAFTAAGAGLLPHLMGDALIGFIEQSSKFLKAVYPGDTLYPQLEITAITPQRTTGVLTCRSTVHNQNGDLVLEGEHKYLVRL